MAASKGAILENNPEEGVFFGKTYKNPKGEIVLKLDGYEVREHTKYGTSLQVKFVIVDEGEFEGQTVSVTVWPNQNTGKLEPTYGTKPNNFARLQMALMGRKLRDGEPLNLKKLSEAGASMKAYIREDVKEDGSRWPKVDLNTLEPVGA